MISRRSLLFASLLAPWLKASAAEKISATVAKRLPWVNWSGALRSLPAQRLAPHTELELIHQLRQLSGEIRPVGSGHSFSALVPTDENLVIVDNLGGLIQHDPQRLTAIFGAGARLGDTGPMLDSVGQAMFNLPDIDRQTLAGAVSTSTHGTGVGLGSSSAYVNYLRLVRPNGEVVELSREQDEDRFLAARVSLGSFGVLSQIGCQNRAPFRLRSKTWVEPTVDVLRTFDERAATYEHYEFLPFPHADFSLVIAHQETTDALVAPAPEEDSGDLFALLNQVPVAIRSWLFNFLLEGLPVSESVQPSFAALTNIRNDRFNEMEYSVPVDVGLDCVSEVLNTISDEGIDVVFPLEYRIIGEDDSWLSMFEGGPRASISIHRSAGLDYQPYFDRIEKIFSRYGGRPHWGKLHTLRSKDLAALYPRFADFVALQKEFDPKGQMLNAHLKQLFQAG